jgi:hypothetical protein
MNRVNEMLSDLSLLLNIGCFITSPSIELSNSAYEHFEIEPTLGLYNFFLCLVTFLC